MILAASILAKIAGLAIAMVIMTGPLYRQQWDVVFIQALVLGFAAVQVSQINRFARKMNAGLDRIEQSLDQIDESLDGIEQSLDRTDRKL